jgi:RimJ/RimL family protein N-acetyltransferase
MYARLSDNTLLYIREIRGDDKQRLADGLANLSEDSVRRRFLGPKPTLSTAELRYLTEVDGHDHYAIVAMPAGEEEQISAVARFVRLDDDPRAAEAAIVVCDTLQGKGLGALLARRLTDAARDRGVERLTATIASDNKPALKLMERIDERLSGAPVGSSVTELVAQLPLPEPRREVAPAGELPAAVSAA